MEQTVLRKNRWMIFWESFSKNVGRPKNKRPHPHHATFRPHFCEIKFLSHSFLCPHGDKSSFCLTRLQLSSCITLSISPLCFPFQIFFFFTLWTGRFASLKAKRGQGSQAYRSRHLRVDGTSWFSIPWVGNWALCWWVVLSLLDSTGHESARWVLQCRNLIIPFQSLTLTFYFFNSNNS